jgi:hypothetical protein
MSASPAPPPLSCLHGSRRENPLTRMENIRRCEKSALGGGEGSPRVASIAAQSQPRSTALAKSTASSSPSMRRARLATSCSASPATWASIRGDCLEAPRPRLWRRPMQILDRDQEPRTPGLQQGEGRGLSYSVPTRLKLDLNITCPSAHQ